MIKHRELTVQTPTGTRQMAILPHGFAMLREGFAPHDPARADQRLGFKSWVGDQPHVAPDGVFVGPKMLWALMVATVKRGHSRPTSEVIRDLFYIPFDADRALKAMFSDPANSEFIRLMTGEKIAGFYDPETKTIWRKA